MEPIGGSRELRCYRVSNLVKDRAYTRKKTGFMDFFGSAGHHGEMGVNLCCYRESNLVKDIGYYPKWQTRVSDFGSAIMEKWVQLDFLNSICVPDPSLITSLIMKVILI